MYLKLTEEQIAILKHLQGVSFAKKIKEMRFERPDEDEANIRRAIYLDGEADCLEYLLGYDAALTEQLEQEKRDLLQTQEEKAASQPTQASSTF